jgi:hypothetical protein
MRFLASCNAIRGNTAWKDNLDEPDRLFKKEHWL